MDFGLTVAVGIVLAAAAGRYPARDRAVCVAVRRYRWPDDRVR